MALSLSKRPEPGYTLEVRIQKSDLAISVCLHAFGLHARLSSARNYFPYRKNEDPFPLDRERMMPDSPWHRIPLRPFFGIIGRAPPEGFGRH